MRWVNKLETRLSKELVGLQIRLLNTEEGMENMYKEGKPSDRQPKGPSATLLTRIIKVNNGTESQRTLTEHAQQVNLFLTLGVGHVDDALVALGSADVGKTDTGVSGGSLNNRSASLDQSYFPHQVKQVNVGW